MRACVRGACTHMCARAPVLVFWGRGRGTESCRREGGVGVESQERPLGAHLSLGLNFSTFTSSGPRPRGDVALGWERLDHPDHSPLPFHPLPFCHACFQLPCLVPCWPGTHLAKSWFVTHCHLGTYSIFELLKYFKQFFNFFPS